MTISRNDPRGNMKDHEGTWYEGSRGNMKDHEGTWRIMRVNEWSLELMQDQGLWRIIKIYQGYTGYECSLIMSGKLWKIMRDTLRDHEGTREFMNNNEL